MVVHGDYINNYGSPPSYGHREMLHQNIVADELVSVLKSFPL